MSGLRGTSDMARGMKSADRHKAFGEIPLGGAFRKGDQSVEKYKEQYTDINGFVKEREGYRKKGTTPEVSSNAPMVAPMKKKVFSTTSGSSGRSLLGG